jgi:hypothetical protein
MAYGRADITSTSQYIKTEVTEIHVEYTYPHDANNLCVLMPKSHRVDKFINLFLPFPELIWAVILCELKLNTSHFVRKYGEMSLRRRTRKFAISKAFFDIILKYIHYQFLRGLG